MSYYMGIDLGTSSVKVLIADEKGRTKGIGQAGYDVLTPQVGYAEQDVQVWWNAARQAIGQALGAAGIKAAKIAAIGFSGQMHGLAALDINLEPAGSAIIHLDARSAKEREYIMEAAQDLMETELLNQPGTGMLIASLLWMKRNQPEIYEKVRYVMSPKDYIRYRLTGEIGTDYSDAAATLAFSVKNRCWCRELIRRLGLKEDIWPKVYESSAVTGTVTKAAAVQTGLAQGTCTVAGAGDSLAAMIGNAITEPGIMACNIGTASQLAVITDHPVFDADMRCQLWCHALPDSWAYQGGALNGGNTLSWLKDKALRESRPFAELDREAGAVPAGCEGLIFLPYLAGERTPFQNPQARGVYFGLTLKHDQAYLVRATMEGVMYNLRACRSIFDEMQIRYTKLIASGGGAKGQTWKQIQADMLDMPVYTTKTEEEACLGAAILAAAGTDHFRDIREACSSMVRVDDTVTEPIPERVRYYKEHQEIFNGLYGRVKDLYGNIE